MTIIEIGSIRRVTRAHHLQSPPQRPRVGERAEVPGPVLGRAAGNDGFRVVVLDGYLEKREPFVISQPNVVRRLLLLVEGHLEEKGLHLGVGDDGLQVVDPINQSGLLGVIAAAGPKIGANTLIQSDGFSDVQHPALAVLHEVHAWSSGQMVQLVL